MIFLTDELVLNLHAPNRLTVLDVLAALKPVN